jgi:hypothetical protein
VQKLLDSRYSQQLEMDQAMMYTKLFTTQQIMGYGLSI